MDIQKIKEINKSYADKPILIKHGNKFFIYGFSEQKEWKLTEELDSSKFERLKFGCVTKTKADGDCALHAILGEWNEREGQLICTHVKKKKEKIRAVIVSPDNKQDMQNLITDGIKELVMSGRNDIGSLTQGLGKKYQQFLHDQKGLSSENWSRFEAVLRQPQHQNIIDYIQRNHQLDQASPLYEQFYDSLNRKEGELYGRILSLPTLHEAFQEYNQLQNTEFDWESAITGKIKEEYAEFLGREHVWLLPSELAIIAHVFDKTVNYYPDPNSSFCLRLNPGKQSTVTVQFNGVNHYERLESSHDGDAIILPGRQIPREVYQEIALKKGHHFSDTLIELKYGEKQSQPYNEIMEFCKEIYFRLKSPELSVAEKVSISTTFSSFLKDLEASESITHNIKEKTVMPEKMTSSRFIKNHQAKSKDGRYISFSEYQMTRSDNSMFEALEVSRQEAVTILESLEQKDRQLVLKELVEEMFLYTKKSISDDPTQFMESESKQEFMELFNPWSKDPNDKSKLDNILDNKNIFKGYVHSYCLEGGGHGSWLGWHAMNQIARKKKISIHVWTKSKTSDELEFDSGRSIIVNSSHSINIIINAEGYRNLLLDSQGHSSLKENKYAGVNPIQVPGTLFGQSSSSSQSTLVTPTSNFSKS